MTEIVQASQVDRAGNLVLHGRGGAVITMDFTDEAGAPRNVSALTLMFEVDGVARVSCATVDGNTARRTATLTRTQVQAIGAQGRAQFALIDETSTPIVLWSGTARVDGYLTQPS